MKDKLIQIRVDAEFLSKLEYLQKINGFKSTAETLRKTVEKEWRRQEQTVHGHWIQVNKDTANCNRCNCETGMMRKLGKWYFPNFCPECGADMRGTDL